MKKKDPILDRIRAARVAISARFNHDPVLYLDHLRKLTDENKAMRRKSKRTAKATP